MPASKKGTTKKRTSTKRTESKGSTKKVSRAKRTVSTGKKEKVPAPSPAMTLLTQLMPPVLLLLALLLLICLLSPAHMGLLGGVMRSAMTGLLGGGAYLVPLLLAVIALFFKGDAEKKTVGLRVLYASLLCLFFSVLLQLWVNPDNPHTFDVGGMWQKGSELVGGGALGGVLGEGIYVIMGGWGTPILAVAALIILSFLLFNLTPATLYHAIVGRFRAQREEMARKERLARASAERGGKRYSIRPADPPPAAPRRHLRAVREPTLPPVTGRHAIRVPLDMPASLSR